MFRQEFIERNAFLLLVLTLVTIAIGGIVEVVPLFTIETTVEHVKGIRPYSPLEQRGRDVYVREGCYLCHSQMIRPFRDEVERYGHYSLAAESMYDHPFQWGSKRTGPDLARVGSKYPHLWHWRHLQDPRSTSPGSNMPPYAFMANAPIDFGRTEAKVSAMKTLGVPYSDADVSSAPVDARKQGERIATELREAGADDANPDSELVALVAYLQSLGRKTEPKPAPASAPLAERK